MSCISGIGTFSTQKRAQDGFEVHSTKIRVDDCSLMPSLLFNEIPQL